MDADVAERLLPLEGGINFRDMGGYETEDGRRVKWRTLYRSGMMTRLTPADVAHLTERGIRTVVDLRTVTEQTNYPSHWCREAGVTYWCREHNEVFGNLHAMVEAGIPSVDAARAVMIGGFRELPFQQAPAYAELFRRIAAGEVPIVFNCMAGKDRTGIAVAALQLAVGVHRDDVLEDYVLTNTAGDVEARIQAGMATIAAVTGRIDEAIMRILMGVEPEYLEAAFAAMAERHGSIDGYLREALGADDALREKLRDALVE